MTTKRYFHLKDGEAAELTTEDATELLGEIRVAPRRARITVKVEKIRRPRVGKDYVALKFGDKPALHLYEGDTVDLEMHDPDA